jgi:hypothetical protein
MKFEDIYIEWEQDSNIDISELDHESLKIPKLHHKYYTIFVVEKNILRKYESEMKKLKLVKFEFYGQGPSIEQKNKGWKLPPKGNVIRADIPMYLDADDDMIELSLRIGIQQEKIEFLDSIIKSLNVRNFNIKNSIDFIKWKSGK